MIDIVHVGAAAADELSELHGACFDQAWSATTFRRLMTHRGTFALVARHNDHRADACGFALVRVIGEECELLTLGVPDVSRRHGIAARLMTAAFDRAAHAGAVDMILEVAEDNEAARRLYDKFAFYPVGRRPRYYARDNGAADAITMKRSLVPQTDDDLRTRSR